ncbi:MAG: TPM domain-containing protein [Acidobacteria bacterium]|nr:TPM domain-containing protein [Acidobacteriota bacterium]
MSMVKGRRFKILSPGRTAFLALAICFFASAHARGQDCERAVVDEAGELGSGAGLVESAAQELVNAGADVRVRTVRDFGGSANLDLYEADLEARCASWRAPDGGMKNNLIVFIVSFGDNRGAGLYYGSLWKRTLDPQWNGIMTDEVVPRLRDGDATGAYVSGLKEIARVITAPRTAPPASVPAPTARETSIEGRALSVLGWGFGLLALVFLAGIGALLYHLARKERAKRLAAQQKARLAKSSCSSSIVDLESPIGELSTQLVSVAAEVSAEDAGPLSDAIARARTGLSDASARFAELIASVSDPEREGLTTEQYDQISASYEQVHAMLDGVRKEKEQIDRDLGELNSRMARVPGAIDSAAAAIDEAEAAVKRVASEGYRIDGAPIDAASALLAQARADLQQKRYGAAEKSSAQAAEGAAAAARDAMALPVRRAAIEKAIPALKARIEQVGAAIDAAQGVFEEVAATYAESSWAPVRGNGTEAENRIDWSAEALEDATEGVSMERQTWKESEEALAEATGWLDEAESFMRSIAALKTNLEAARRDAPGEIDAAQRDIDAARAFIRSHGADVRGALGADLEAAQGSLQQARDQLAQSRPDYVQALKLAMNANKTADDVLVQARSEHEAAERQRQRAESARRESERSVSAAREYIEDHSRDAGGEAKRGLGEARRALEAALGELDLARRIALLEQADRGADAALASARRDAEEADRRRRATTRIATSPTIGWGTRSSSSPSSRTRSSGGFSSGGSSRGGGSVSWGSSSRGGGSVSAGRSSRGGGSVGW